MLAAILLAAATLQVIVIDNRAEGCEVSSRIAEGNRRRARIEAGASPVITRRRASRFASSRWKPAIDPCRAIRSFAPIASEPWLRVYKYGIAPGR